MDLEYHQYDVRSLQSVSGHFPAERGRRGIYVLHFEDGMGYVGQTVDICARFAAHRRTYPDLITVRFARVPDQVVARELNRLEQDQIRLHGRWMELRNISHYLGRDITLRPSPLDPAVPATDQLSFLNDGAVIDVAERAVDPARLAAGAAAYQRLRRRPRSDDAIALARRYVQTTIPCPRATEARFWAVSAAPSTKGGARLLTLSVNKPETLVIGEIDGRGWAFVNVSRTALVNTRFSLWAFRRRHRWVEVDEEAGYEACGGDAVRLLVESLPDLSRLLDDRAVVEAAAFLNLQLMCKGTTLQARWHNYQLAENLLGR